MKKQDGTTDVLVVGAGPTGLTMACELLRRGITFRILDKATAPGTTSRAVGIMPRTLEVFDQMGIIEEVMSKGVRAGMRIYERQRLLLHMDFHALVSDANPYPFPVMLPQQMTEAILSALLQQVGGVVEYSKEVTGFRQEGQEVVVTVHHLQDDTVEDIRARWLIGCDGAHSVIRKALNLSFEGRTYDEICLMGDVSLDWDRSPTDVYTWLHPEGQLGIAPLPNHQWRLIATFAPGVGKEIPEASVESFQRLLWERAADSTTTVSQPTWMSTFTINRRMVGSLRKERVFLAGDAAHVHSPVGGQGMNTGIQDAFNLAWKLALVIKGRADDALLVTYQNERLPVARQVLAGTDLSTRVLFASNQALRLLRDRVMIPLLKREFVQRRIILGVSQLGITYRRSPLSRSAHGHSARKPGPRLWRRSVPGPGDRAPDGACLRLPDRTSTRLFQEFGGTTFHLLLFDGLLTTSVNSTRLMQVAQSVKEVLKEEVKISVVVSQDKPLENADWGISLLLDPEHRLHARYGAASPSVYFIRPDGYIGFCGQPVEVRPLLDYLGQWFKPAR